MTKSPDIRSQQRFENFKKAFQLYEEAAQKPGLSRLEMEGLIQRFEYCFELAWKCLQDLLRERGYTQAVGPRPVIEQAFQDGVISDGVTWLKMLKARNDTTHLYNEATFNTVSLAVCGEYLELFRDFRKRFGKQPIAP